MYLHRDTVKCERAVLLNLNDKANKKVLSTDQIKMNIFLWPTQSAGIRAIEEKIPQSCKI